MQQPEESTPNQFGPEMATYDTYNPYSHMTSHMTYQGHTGHGSHPSVGMSAMMSKPSMPYGMNSVNLNTQQMELMQNAINFPGKSTYTGSLPIYVLCTVIRNK